MKKRSWSKVHKILGFSKSIARKKKLLKRLRNKRRRQTLRRNKFWNEKHTDAWTLY